MGKISNVSHEIADMITAFFKDLNTDFAVYSAPIVETESDDYANTEFLRSIRDNNQVRDGIQGSELFPENQKEQAEKRKEKYKAKVDMIRYKIEAHFMELEPKDIAHLRSLIKGKIESFNKLLKFKYYGTPNDLEGFKYLIRWFVHTLKDTHDLTNLILLPDAMDEDIIPDGESLLRSHTLALIFKLGIADLLKEKFKGGKPNDTELAKLIAVIIGETDKNKISSIRSFIKDERNEKPKVYTENALKEIEKIKIDLGLIDFE